MGSILSLVTGEMGTTTTFPRVQLEAARLNLLYKERAALYSVADQQGAKANVQ